MHPRAQQNPQLAWPAKAICFAPPTAGIWSSLSCDVRRVLAINVVLVAVAMGGGKTGLYAMFATFFFMSSTEWHGSDSARAISGYPRRALLPAGPCR